MTALIAQIALGVIIGGLTLVLLVKSFIMWVQSRQGRPAHNRLARFAIGLFIAGVVVVVALVAVVAIQ